LLAADLAAMALIDPYDTGYFPSLIGAGVVDDNDVTGIAGRGRNNRFDAAIFGNSHGLLIDPGRLSSATGLSFVQLTPLGSGPREQMVLIQYFLRRHAKTKAVVLAADRMWCTHDSSLHNTLVPLDYQFPDWLFGESRLQYLANLLSARPYRLAGRRVLFAMGRLAPIDPVGTASYPAAWDLAQAPDAIPEVAIPLTAPNEISTIFPAIDRLEKLVATLPDGIAFVIAMPPLHTTLLPQVGTRQAAELVACKARLARVAGNQPHRAFLDFLVDSPLSRVRANFIDLHHMRENVARAMEPRIAQVLNRRNRENSTGTGEGRHRAD
jgi:hypothetical protein